MAKTFFLKYAEAAPAGRYILFGGSVCAWGRGKLGLKLVLFFKFSKSKCYFLVDPFVLMKLLPTSAKVQLWSWLSFFYPYPQSSQNIKS